MIRTLLLAFGALAIVFWVGLAYWVNKDARRRVGPRSLVALATAVGLIPILGLVVYVVFRPVETLDEARARRAELAVLAAMLGRDGPACPECSAPIDGNYLVCPVCTTRLKVPCATCAAPLHPLWQMCPHCETSIEAETELDLDAALTRELRRVPMHDRATEPAEV